MSYVMTFMLVFLFPWHVWHHSAKERLVVWSVGQGQMVTYSNLKYCVHFDMGGEFFPVKKLIKECGQKLNQVFFSHWDWDHINFAKKAYRRLPSFCQLNQPGGKGSSKKKKFLSIIPKCQTNTHPVFREIVFPMHRNRDKRASEANKFSRVVIIRNTVLIAGDSPGSSEFLWKHQVPKSIRILIVSHHGSRYSTTPSLLKVMPHLKIAIASARKKRYGHPHPLVKKRLLKRAVGLISTDDFNHIYIPLPK